MTFTAFVFWGVMLPVLLLLYHVCARRVWAQNLVLIAAACVFYGSLDPKFLPLLAACILLTWAGGGLTAHCGSIGRPRAAKACFVTALVLNIGILAVFKYTPFILQNLNLILAPSGRAVTLSAWLLPVGLSFYIFQSSSYLIDVYRGDVSAEKNLLTYAAFVSFFTSIVSGPILKSRDMLPAFRERRTLSYDVFRRALVRFLYGAFLKMIVADRLALFVNAVYADVRGFAGPAALLAAFAYTLQIYTDFSGYSHMSIAVAAVLGFRVRENFRQPYLADSIADFWRRWHISLTDWFRDYLYIPLGGNRKGAARKYLNTALVFIVSGLWHGAAWTFVAWGALHAAYQIAEAVTRPVRERICAAMHVHAGAAGRKALRRVVVFVLVTAAWVLFRSPDLRTAGALFAQMFRGWSVSAIAAVFSGQAGLAPYEWIVCAAGIVLMIVISVRRERGTLGTELFLRQRFPLRAAAVLTVFGVLLVWGVYGPAFAASSFIYAGF